jgi:hypothetical protein
MTESNFGIISRNTNLLTDPLSVLESHVKHIAEGELDPQPCDLCYKQWETRFADEDDAADAILEGDGPVFNPACATCQSEFEELVAHVNEYKARVGEILRLRQEANHTGLSWCGVGGAC